MLSCTLAMPATISTAAAIMNMAALMSTTRKFAENTCNSTTLDTQYQEQRGEIKNRKGEVRNE